MLEITTCYGTTGGISAQSFILIDQDGQVVSARNLIISEHD